MQIASLHGRRALRLVPLAVVAIVALTTLFGSSSAATPGAGTVSATNTSVTWTGDWKVPTGGGCKNATDATCDLYQLTVVPPSYSFQVIVKLAPTGDWDLDVFGPDGSLAGNSGNGPNQTETVVLVNPPAGTYTVAAAPFAPAPVDTYTASATIVPATAATAASGTAHLTFSSYHAPQSVGGQDAGEPSLGGDLKTGKVMYQAGLDALRVTFDDSASPGSASWENVSFPQAAAASLDPIGFMDQRTNRWFSSQLSGTTSLAATTDDDGSSWLPSEGGPGNGGVDHQTIGGGPYHAPLSGTPLYPDATYYCSQDLVAALCARSDDGGTTFAPAVPIYTSECGGLHGHVEVAPDGTVYVPNKNCGGHQAVVVSEDNGITWSIRTLPSSGPGAWDPAVATDKDGTLYFAYDDADGHAKVAVSHDRGQTWASITDVGAPLGVNQSAFPAAIAGDSGRAAVAFVGTSETANGAFGDNPSWPGVWYVYSAITTDGGSTWSAANATPGDPIQRGTLCSGGFSGCNNGTRNMLDFGDASVDSTGHVVIAYADGCVGACVAAGPGSFTSVAALIREVSGPRLFAQYDTTGVPAAPALTAKAVSSPASNLLTWQEPDDHGSAITGYRVYRNGALLTSTTSTSYTDTALTAGTSYTYTVSAVNGFGEGPKSAPATPQAVVSAPSNPCVEPGAQILTDPTGDSTGGDPAKDVQWLNIAETPQLGAGNIEFLLKVASLQSVPVDTIWPVQLQTADGKDHWVRMKSSATGTVSFGYGDGTGYTGTAVGSGLASSGYGADGTIRIVIPRSVWNIQPGDKLSAFLTRISVNGVAVNLTPDNMPDSLARTGTYTVKGNENCSTPQPDLAISGSDIGFSGLKGSGNLQAVVAVVHNTGDAAATNVLVAFTVDGVQIGTATVPSLAAGGVARASTVWDTKGQNGTHTVAATADPANVIKERSETNNTGSKLVTVQGSKVTG